jgi:hypothetical protein
MRLQFESTGPVFIFVRRATPVAQERAPTASRAKPASQAGTVKAKRATIRNSEAAEQRFGTILVKETDRSKIGGAYSECANGWPSMETGRLAPATVVSTVCHVPGLRSNASFHVGPVICNSPH